MLNQNKSYLDECLSKNVEKEEWENYFDLSFPHIINHDVHYDDIMKFEGDANSVNNENS